MAGRIEDYGLIGDNRTVALVCRDGSIDWFCVPRIDSPAALAALLGDEGNGRWSIAPASPSTTTRRYLPDTLVLETVHETGEGALAVTDFMAPGADSPCIHRIVECRSGEVAADMELVVRFDYGSIVPWVESTGDGLRMVAGPDGLRLHSPVVLEGKDQRTVARFTLRKGERLAFSLTWYDSSAAAPMPADGLAALEATVRWWQEWVAGCTYAGAWRDDVVRSLITLKALTYAPSGAVCAAATTSLPEGIGGVRNWDYRYSWLRDATLTLQAFLVSGYRTEARDWARWLRRAVAGNPGDFQIMYGVARRAAPHRGRAGLAGGLRGVPARAGGQRRRPPSSSSTCSAR